MKRYPTLTVAALMMGATVLFSPQSAQAKTSTKNNRMSQNGKSKSTNTFAKPDFAFPEDVVSNASKALDEGVAAADWSNVLRALEQLSVADGMRQSDATDASVARIDSVSALMPTPYRQVAKLLMATLYTAEYKDNKWRYNNRTLPLDVWPAKSSEWSGDLFLKRVTELCGEAWNNLGEEGDRPLTLLAPAVTGIKANELKEFSVRDFVAIRITELLTDYLPREVLSNGSEGVLPLFDSPSGAESQSEGAGAEGKSAGVKSQGEELLRKVYQEWLNKSNPGSHPQVLAILSYANQMSATERASFLRVRYDMMVEYANSLYLLQPLYNAVMEGCGRYRTDDSKETLDIKKSMYLLMQEGLKRHPKSDAAGDVKFLMARIAQKHLDGTIPEQALPGVNVQAVANASNVNSATFALVKVPVDADEYIAGKNVQKIGKWVKKVDFSFEGTVPFNASDTVGLGALEPGRYILMPSSDGTLKGALTSEALKESFNTMLVSDLTPVTMSDRHNGKRRFYVARASDQAPVEGATVTCYKRDWRQSRTDGLVLLTTGVTDADGYMSIPDEAVYVKISKGDEYWRGDISGVSRASERNKFDTVEILPDRSIYRPGDTIEFVAVTYGGQDRSLSLQPNREVKISLCDANGETLDTLRLTSDASGRVNGRFTIPTGRLLGRWSLRADAKEKDLKFQQGRCMIRVEDYKLPTFRVVIDAPKEGVKPGEKLMLKGVATTYSGMPVGNAEVEIDVNTVNRYFRYWNPTPSGSCSTVVTTAEDGTFEVPLDLSRIEGTPYANGTFSLQATVTDAAGETRSAEPYEFSLSKGFSISPSVNGKIEVTGDTVSFNVRVFDNIGTPVQKNVECRIVPVTENGEDSEGARTLTFVSPVLNVPADRLPSGRYNLYFKLEGEDDGQSVNAQTVIYRADDTKAPAGSVLWLPEERIVAPKGARTVQVKVGSSFPGSWLLWQITDLTGNEKFGWSRVDETLGTIEVPVPDGTNRWWLNVSAVHNLTWEQGNVQVLSAEQDEKLTVKTESFRSAVAAGDKEHWTFRFCNTPSGAVPGAQVYAMGVMTDAALNAISPFKWDFNPSQMLYFGSQGYIVGYADPGYSGFRKNFTGPRYVSSRTLGEPDFQSWGYGFAGGGRFVYYDSVVNEVYSTGAVTEQLSVVMPTARSMEDAEMARPEAKRAMRASASKSEGATADSNGFEEEDAGEGGADVRNIDLRPSDLPVAFFQPDLSADPDGVVTVNFDVPDYNTTWQMQLMGYTPDMETTSVMVETTASKQVMVTLNSPRFMRTGDNAVLAATLYNNSDAELGVSGRIEVVTPEGKVIASKNYKSEKLAPASNRVVQLPFAVPADVMQLYVRSYAMGGTHTDGEETLLEVLPSSTPVIESKPFWMAPAQADFELKLPKYDKNATVTLSYCDNPVWSCMTALPDIVTPESDNIFSLSRALYGNCIGYGLMKSDSRLRAGLQSVLSAHDGDRGLLTSPLEKDDELKSVALPATPWLNNARGETARMHRLGTLLDSVQAPKTIDELISRIGKMQNADGSWSWCDRMPGSAWITGMTLLHFGMLNSLGYLPAGGILSSQESNPAVMMKRGVDYVDTQYAEEYAHAKKRGDKHPFSTEAMNNWLYIRSLCGYSDFSKSAAPMFKELASKAVSAIAEEWRDFDIYNKATAVMTLKHSGKSDEARLILESLSQTALTSPEKGMWFDNLDSGFTGWPSLITTAQVLEAYAALEPDAPQVDLLRQWLVVERQVQDWGDNSYTAEVINAILTSGSEWTVSGTVPEIRLRGKKLTLPAGEALTGAFTMQINPSDASGATLSIRRDGSAGPAWGGVVSQYVAPISDVKAEAIEPLSISKEMVVIDNDGTPRRGGDYKVGDLVRVTLTVNCDRNMDYVALTDERAACLEPVAQMSAYTATDGVWCYREVRDASTNLFFNMLPKGTHVFTYDCRVSQEGEYATGIATIQSQYSPLMTAHSAGCVFNVRR